MGGDKGVVCVTEGTSYIGSWLIKVTMFMPLLDLTQITRETLASSPAYQEQMKGLRSLEQILDICGCKGVLHVAAPMDFEDNEPEALVTQHVIDGALGILKACLGSETVKRVIYTSSISAMYLNKSNVETMDESHWTDVDYVRSELNSYISSYTISKSLTKKAAFEFARQLLLHKLRSVE